MTRLEKVLFGGMITLILVCAAVWAVVQFAFPGR
jgi:hypothetical protein